MSDHFEGKTPLEHVIEARKKGRAASTEAHGIEMPGHLAAFADSIKESAVYLMLLALLLSIVATPLKTQLHFLLLFILSLLIWKTGRSWLLASSRMERLARLSAEELYEIEHNPEQEREELSELYEAKGFTGELLDRVIDVLMADKNRALRIMLEEELCIPVEAYEHPLKQAFGAFLGVLFTASLFLIAFFYLPLKAVFGVSLFLVTIATYLTADTEKNRVAEAIIWTLSLFAITIGASFFLHPLFK